MDTMEFARKITSMEPETAHKEVFELIKQDKTLITQIVKSFVDEILPDILAIKTIVNEYNHPMSLDEKNESESK